MILYPAIDLRGGKVVRLQEGDPNRQTVFSDNPLETAQTWLAQGAEWLHVVNLDGAFGEDSPNLRILEQLTKLKVNVQFGGGLRSLEHVKTAIDLGASRVVLGTVAIQQPQVVMDAVQQFGSDCVCVALDAKDGKITTHGWQTASELTPVALGLQMAQVGVKHALFTDVSRDGKLSGVNVAETLKLAQETPLGVIASGGVSSLEDIRALNDTQQIAGVIIGMALYTGKFTLSQALELIKDA
jgi:phosphoribosylformimino-5-aminoimidazole carboxamide ribotide isomerase